MLPLTNSYDDVPYDSFAFPQTQPDRLATIARLFSLKAVIPSRARMLEIGCASGDNLIPLAYRYPDAAFIGIDLSSRQIENGQARVRALGLKNITLVAQNLMDVSASFGTFDYIVAHGVYSWIPPQVKEKLLSILHDNLSAEGVAYVSYNTYPGWRMRGMIRDMMRYHVAAIPDLRQRATQARALLEFLRSSVALHASAYSKLLGEESNLLGRLPDNYLIHEHLEDDNEPLYFHEFVERAARAGMQFVCEADFQSSMPQAISRQEVLATVLRISPDMVHMEQYADFLLNRTMRQSLLVKDSRAPKRSLGLDAMRGLFVELAARPEPGNPNASDSSKVTYIGRNGASIVTSNPITKTALGILHLRRPESISFEELYLKARTAIGFSGNAHATAEQSSEDTLAMDLLHGYSAAVLDLHVEAFIATSNVSERPVAFAPARYFATLGHKFLPSAGHQPLELDDFTMKMLPLLDGGRDIMQLTNELVDLVSTGKLAVQENGKAITDAKRLRESAAASARQSLGRLRDLAFLTG